MSYKRNKIQLDTNLDYDFDNDLFGPSTFEEMDRKFRQFSAQFSGRSKEESQIAPRKGSLKKGASPRGLDSKKKVGWSTPGTYTQEKDENIGSETENKNEPGRTLKRMNSKKLGRMNSNSGWVAYDEKTQQLSKEFGITLGALSNFENPAEKEQYIIQCIRKSLNADFQEFNKKHNAKLAQIKNFERNFDKEKEKMQDDKTDIFKWLNVKTPFEPLKKKLRSKLVETITDHENQEKIEKSLDGIKKSIQGSLYSSTMKITLDKVPEINNTEILMDDLGQNGHGLFKTSKMHKKTQSISVMNSTNTNSRFLSPQSRPMSSNSSQFGSSHIKPEIKIAKASEDDEEEKQIENALKQGYTWNADKEEIFHNHRNSAKHRLFNKVKASSWNEVGFSPLVQASQMDEKSKLQRDTKLAKYMNGDALSPDEYKFLASTSRSLNACIDKKFLQAAVNYLDPEIIEAIEVDLAQNILHEYQNVRQRIKEARLGYLKGELNQKIENVKKNQIKFERTMRVLQGMEEQQRVKRKLLNFLREYQKKQILKNTDRSQETEIYDVDVGHFAKKLMKPIQQKVETRKLIQNENFLRQVVHLPSGPKEKLVDVKESRHFFHPPSKVVVDPEKHTRDFMGLGASLQDPLVAQRLNEPPSAYQLNINSPPSLKNPLNFRKFYSGGPGETEIEIFQGNYIVGDPSGYKITKFEETILIKLQSLWRGFKQREIFRHAKEQAMERIQMNQRMEYLKNKSESAFLRTVLLAKERIQLNSEPREDNPDRRNYEQFGKTYEGQLSVQQETQNRDVMSLSNLDRGNSPKIVTALRGTFDRIMGGQHTGSHQPAIANLSNFDQSDYGMQDNKKRPSRMLSPSSLKDLSKSQNGVIRPMTATNKNRQSFGFPSNESSGNNKGGNTRLARPASSNNFRIKSPSNRFASESLKINLKKESDDRQSSSSQKDDKASKNERQKGLLLKQRKLFTAAKSGTIHNIEGSGFNYFESDVNVKDDHGNTPLFYAARRGNKEICDFLLAHKARVNEPCSNGNTPLHMAFASNQVMLIIEMIAHGGNLNTLNDFGQTPVAFGSQSVIELLDLKSAIATFDKKEGQRFLPKEYDNNRLLKRFQKRPADEKGTFQYNSLDSPDVEVTQGETEVRSFIPPGERKTAKFLISVNQS